MGQISSNSSKIETAVEKFLNLPHKCIASLWQNFNDYADGFGITEAEFDEICSHLHEDLGCSTISMKQHSKALFELLDTDHNGLIDALEALSMLAAVSGLPLAEVVQFVLSCYDFDGQQELCIDEVTLALKSLSLGLCKISSVDIPKEQLLEVLVSKMFEDILQKEDDNTALQISVLTKALCAHPDVLSWFHCFSSPVDRGLPSVEVDPADVDYLHENLSAQHTSGYLANAIWKSKPASAVESRAPWVEVARNMMPAEFAGAQVSHKPPAAALELTWVYGYESQRGRNNVLYDFNGRIVYPSGRYVIVFSIDGNRQEIFSGHADLVLCLAAHPDGKIFASGDGEAGSRLLVWDVASLELLFCSNYHKRGVVQTAFSKDGVHVAAVGNSEYKCLTVHNWKTGDTIYSSLINKQKCLSLVFLKGDCVAVAGENYLFVWSKSSEGYRKLRGNYSYTCPVQPITCLVSLLHPDTFASGTVNGSLYLWHNRNAIKKSLAHQGMVESLYASENAVISGGKDKRVRLWTHRLEPAASFDFTGFGGNASIRSLCLSKDGVSILLGTKGSDIFEASAVDGSDLRGGPLASGHFMGYVHGVAACKVRQEISTVGDDGTLRVWDLVTHTLLKVAKFDAQLRCVCYSPAGDLLAIGMGDAVGESRDGASAEKREAFGRCGAYAVLNEQDLAVLHEARDSHCPLSFVGISGDGETLAFGSEDGTIYLYALLDDYEFIGKCIRHSSPISAIDFSVDGELLRSNSTNGELFYFNADDASNISTIPALRDIQWESFKCPYSWHSLSAHGSEFEGEELTSSSLQATQPILTVGSNYGYIKLFSFPAVHADAKCCRFKAHTGPVSQIVHAGEDGFLLSTGLYDRTMLQWRIVASADAFSDDVSLDVNTHGREGSSTEEIVKYLKASTSVPPIALINGDPFKDESKMAIKDLLSSTVGIDSWLGGIVPPSSIPVFKHEVPKLSLCLDHVYGFSCLDMRNNVRYTAQGEFAYAAGSFGVVTNSETQIQKFCRAHDDLLTSFACSDDGQIAATGQLGSVSKVVVWETRDCSVLKTMGYTFTTAVTVLCFSGDGIYIAASGADPNNTIVIFDWRHDFVVAQTYTGVTRVTSIGFSQDSKTLVSTSVHDIKLHKLSSYALVSHPANLRHVESKGPFLSCLFFSGCAVVGSSDGHLHIFNEREQLNMIKAHTGSIDCLFAHSGGDLLLSGGKDGKIKVWNASLDCIQEIAVDAMIKLTIPGLSSVALSRDSTKIVLGTRSGMIVHFKLSSTESQHEMVVVTEGHCQRDLRGLAAHPTKSIFASAGDDGVLKICDALTFTVLRSIKLDAPSRALAFSNDGKYLAVGYGASKRDSEGKLPFKEGGFVIFQTSDMKKLHEGKDSTEPLNVIKFSPDSRLLAIGSQDSKVHVYTVEDLFSIRTVLTCHKAAIRHIDFTLDGQFIMTVDAANKVCYSESTSGVFIPSPAALRDEKWGTWSNPVGWPVLGIWMSQPVGPLVTAAQKSNGGGLLAAGNSRGAIYVSNFPCPSRNGFILESSHSGGVANMSWLAGDTHLVTVGCSDHMVMQWRCVYDASKELGDDGSKFAGAEEFNKLGGHDFDDRAISRIASRFGKIQQWQSSICPPSKAIDDSLDAPEVAVELVHAHGVRLADCQHAVRYNADGNPVFIVGTLAIIDVLDQHRQILYEWHSSATTCIDVTPDGLYAATGELSDFPQLHIWDACTAAPVTKFASIHRQGITCVAFGRSGEYIVSLGQDPLNSLVVCRSPSKRWGDGYVQASMSTSPSKMLWVLFMEDNRYPIIAGGKGGICFFSCSQAGTERVAGTFGKGRVIQPLICAAPGICKDSSWSILTGTASGHLYEWLGETVVSSVTAHDMAVSAVANIGRNGYASGAGDGMIKVWSHDLKPLYTINALLFVPLPIDLNFHVICPNLSCNKIAIGMKSCEVYELTLQTRSTILISQSHSKMQLHGLACNPTNPDEYATAGDDGLVMIWSIVNKACIRKSEVDNACRAIVWSPDGARLVIGLGGNPASTLKDGAFMILDAVSLQILFEDRKSKLAISDVCFSGGGDSLLAIASCDGKVYLHDTKTFEMLRAIAVPDSKASIWRIDFSIDGEYLRLATLGEEMFDASVKDGALVMNPASTKDVDWATFNCPYNWLTQGVWRAASEGIAVLATAANVSRNIVAASYQNGDIRVYKLPSANFGGKFVSLRGACTQAHRIAFTEDGASLIAIDAYTRTVLQFAIHYSDNKEIAVTEISSATL